MPVIENRKPEIENRHFANVFRPGTRPRGHAVLAMFLAGFLFAIMGLTTKMTHSPAMVGRQIPAVEVAFCRFAFGLLAMLPLQGRRGIQLVGRDRRGLLKRGIWGALAVFFYFLSLQTTTLTHAQLLNYASMVFAPLFSLLLLNERLPRRAVTAIFVAVGGICLITLQGGFAGGLNLGDGYGLLSGILAGASITEIRRLRQTETAWSVFFYLCIVGLPVTGGAALLLGQPFVMPTAAGWWVLLGLAASSVGGQILLTFGYKYVRAGEGGLITMSQLVYSAFAGVLLFHEPLTALTLVGAGLILGSALWLNVGSQSR
jgi:drug/metabolite transporter (DMT)-like permease